MDDQPVGSEAMAHDDDAWVETPPVLTERERQWLEENAAAIESYNAYIAKHGIPGADLRGKWPD